MKILIVHNRYRIRAGEDNVFDQEVALLKRHGNTIKTWIVDNQDIPNQNNLWQQIKLAINTIWSISSYREITKVIRDFKPDIVHVHNTLPLLSPSIFHACKKEKVPVVQTIHNYRLGCPVATFFRDGKICELCLEKTLLNSIRYRCYRDSFLQTTIVAAMLQIHRWLGTWKNTVDGYIALTPFMKEKLIQIGIPEEKIFIKPNFVEESSIQNDSISFGDYYLYVGRLAPEKGIHILLEAYNQSNTAYPLLIIGSGELQDIVEKAAKNNPKIQYLGQQPRGKVLTYMQGAIALIFPSIWYEGLPMTILEAYGQSLPVIASEIGSISHLIMEYKTGLLFSHNESDSLIEKITEIEQNKDKWLYMKMKILDCIDNQYVAKFNQEELVDIYKKIITSQQS